MRLYGMLKPGVHGRLVVNDLDRPNDQNITQMGIETTAEAENFLAAEHGIVVDGWVLDDRYGNGWLVAQGIERTGARVPKDHAMATGGMHWGGE